MFMMPFYKVEESSYHRHLHYPPHRENTPVLGTDITPKTQQLTRFQRLGIWYVRCKTLLPKTMEDTAHKSGDVNEQFGIYKSSCCSSEIVLVKGGVFPLCHKHKLPTNWKLVTEIDSPPPSPKSAAA
jgi:hypothetical protein